MLKTTRSNRFAANPKKTKGKAGGDSVVGDSVIGGGEVTKPKNPTKRKIKQKQLSPKF